MTEIGVPSYVISLRTTASRTTTPSIRRARAELCQVGDGLRVHLPRREAQGARTGDRDDGRALGDLLLLARLRQLHGRAVDAEGRGHHEEDDEQAMSAMVAVGMADCSARPERERRTRGS